MTLPVIDAQLDVAMRTYSATFGHVVPQEVVELFSRRAWMLTSEIRQALYLQRPVRAWEQRSRSGMLAPALYTDR